MRRGVLVFGLIGVVLAGVPAAVGKDTPAAAFTRTKKLKAKVSLDAKEMMLREIFAELDGQLRDQGLSGLSVRYGLGVSQNQRLTFKADDKPLEEVLDGLLRVNKLGYIVISKPGDRYDGWLEITRGEERGYAKGQEPKAAAKGGTAARPKEETAPVPVPEPEEVAKPKPVLDRKQMLENAAGQHLRMAQLYLDSGKPAKARKRLEYILRIYPDTTAGGAAKEILREMGN